MEDKVINFYRRVIFGSKYKVENKKDLDINTIVDCCFIKSWNDMARTYPCKNGREALKDKLKTALRNQVTGGQKYKPREIIEDKNKKYQDLTVGQRQKVVNMFFKYLYTFCDSINIKQEYFEECDCPIDSIILNKLYGNEKGKNLNDTKNVGLKILKGKVEYEEKKYSWSQINDFDRYKELQDLISNLSEGKPRLDFDFDEWG